MKIEKSKNLISVLFPRNRLKDVSADNPELSRPGVHLLRGSSDKRDFKYDCFIGDSSNNKKRLKDRENQTANSTVKKNKKFFNEIWDETIVIVSLKDDFSVVDAACMRKILVESKFNSHWNSERINNSAKGSKELSDLDMQRIRELALESRLLISKLGWKIFDKN